MSLMSPRFAHAPKIDFDAAIKSPKTVKPPALRPQRVLDARVQLSDLKPKHLDKETVNGDYKSSFDTLAHASSRYPCKGWIAIQPSTYEARDSPNVKLVEIIDFYDAIKSLKPSLPLLGVVVWAPLLRGPEEVLAHLDALPKSPSGTPIIGVTYDLTTAPEGTVLQPGFVGSLRALAARKLPIELDLSIQNSGPRVLDELLECLTALEDSPDPVTIIIPALGRPPLPGSSATTNGNTSPTSRIDSDAHLRALAQLGLRPNVHLSLAGLTPPTGTSSYEDRALALALEPALEAFGTGRLLYGSDWPSAAHDEPSLSPSGVRGEDGKYEARFEAVYKALTECGVVEQEELNAVFADNAERLFGLARRS